MRVIIDAERCQGHQMCSIAAPEVFGADDYGNSVLLIEGDIPAELEAEIALRRDQLLEAAAEADD